MKRSAVKEPKTDTLMTNLRIPPRNQRTGWIPTYLKCRYARICCLISPLQWYAKILLRTNLAAAMLRNTAVYPQKQKTYGSTPSSSWPVSDSRCDDAHMPTIPREPLHDWLFVA